MTATRDRFTLRLTRAENTRDRTKEQRVLVYSQTGDDPREAVVYRTMHPAAVVSLGDAPITVARRDDYTTILIEAGPGGRVAAHTFPSANAAMNAARAWVNPWFVNEYETDKAYRGPEEGGWWYDTGRFIQCHGEFPSRDAAAACADRLHDYIAEKRDGLRPPWSVLSSGNWPALHIEGRPGSDYPRDGKPIYE